MHSVLHIGLLHKKHVNHHYDIFVVFGIYILLGFVKLQVKMIHFDGMSKSSAAILDFWISQGKVATHLRKGGRQL